MMVTMLLPEGATVRVSIKGFVETTNRTLEVLTSPRLWPRLARQTHPSRRAVQLGLHIGLFCINNFGRVTFKGSEQVSCPRSFRRCGIKSRVLKQGNIPILVSPCYPETPVCICAYAQDCPVQVHCSSPQRCRTDAQNGLLDQPLLATAATSSHSHTSRGSSPQHFLSRSRFRSAMTASRAFACC